MDTAQEPRPAPQKESVVKTTKIPPKKMRLTSNEAAPYLGMTKRNLKWKRLNRDIPYYRLGHCTICFDIRDLDAYLARNRVEAIG